MFASEFWAQVRPSGKTAEQELIELWQRICACKKAAPAQTGAGSPGRIIRPFAHSARSLLAQALAEDELILSLLPGLLALIEQ